MKRATSNNVIYLHHSSFDFELFLMRIVVAMSRTNMTHYDLANAANLSYDTICRIMGQRSKNMFVGTAAKLAQAIRVSTDFLLGNREARTDSEREIAWEVKHNIQQRRNRKRA